MFPELVIQQLPEGFIGDDAARLGIGETFTHRLKEPRLVE